MFTGIGALCWLPDVRRWAGVVAGLLRPGGRLFIREGTRCCGRWPTPRRTGCSSSSTRTSSAAEPLVFDEAGHLRRDGRRRSPTTVTHEWNHGLGEIVTALLDAGLELTALVEHDSVPWEALRGRWSCSTAASGGWPTAARLPHSYTLQAVKRRA